MYLFLEPGYLARTVARIMTVPTELFVLLLKLYFYPKTIALSAISFLSFFSEILLSSQQLEVRGGTCRIPVHGIGPPAQPPIPE